MHKNGEFIPDIEAARREISDRQTMRQLERERRKDMQAEKIAAWPRSLRIIARIIHDDNRCLFWLMALGGFINGWLWGPILNHFIFK